MRRWVRVLVIAVVTAGSAATGRATDCTTTCNDTYDAAVAACPATADAARDTCVATVNDRWSPCVSDCRDAWPDAGRCTMLHRCLNQCRSDRAGGQRWCRHEPLKRCIRAAQRERKSCRRECLKAEAQPARVPSSRHPAVETEPTPADARASDSCGACFSSCATDVLAYCYGRCDDHCEQDGLARSICQSNCRDYLCDTLTQRCVNGCGCDKELSCTSSGN